MCNKIYHICYKTINIINNKEYIGIHSTNNLKDGYIGSGTILKLAIKKYGKNNFERYILEFFESREDALEYEKILVNEKYISRNDTYNIQCGGEAGKILSYETREKLRKHNIGKKHSMKTREKISNSNKGRKFSVQTREKISKSKVGVKQSKEHIKKLSIIRKGKKIHNEESKKKIGISSRKRAKKLVLNIKNGIYYESLMEAAEANDIKYNKARKLMSTHKHKNDIFLYV